MEAEVKEEEAGSLKPGCVILMDRDRDRIEYLTAIFDFIDFPLITAKDPAEVATRLDETNELDSVSILLAPGFSAEQREELLQLIGKADQLPALITLHATEEELAHGIKEAIGTLRLPMRYEALLNLLRKSQNSRDGARQGKGKRRRPLELFRSMSGNSKAIQKINKMIEQVAHTEATVLILGESGTGKEVVARKLHHTSGRRGKAFVPVNCGAIPADLLESEMFGHEKGAFTGAFSTRQGRFELANGGTLLLDEIGDMSMPMQVKLLRVLQERTFERVGSNKTIECDVRIIAATHRNLELAIAEERFREDLYYRLNVFPIEMPPLRERVEDIPVLVNDLISRIETENRGTVRLSPAAINRLAHFDWPGNVRELANLIERLAILYPYGVVDIKDLPEKFQDGDSMQGIPFQVSNPEELPDRLVDTCNLPQAGLDLKAHLNSMEMSLIKQALDESNGIVAHAAKRLKMRRTTLVEKVRKYGLQRNQDAT